MRMRTIAILLGAATAVGGQLYVGIRMSQAEQRANLALVIAVAAAHKAAEVEATCAPGSAPQSLPTPNKLHL